jgi:hypothetical protein
MDQVVMDRERENEGLEIDVLRQCPTCERCRDCGYTHIGIACSDASRPTSTERAYAIRRQE